MNCKIPWHERVWYFIKRNSDRAYWNTREFPKRWWQRQTRGFDYRELWGLDYTILKFILPRLKAFKDTPPHGYPGDLQWPNGYDWDKEQAQTKEESEIASDKAYKEWMTILNKMIRAIELWLKHDGMFMKEESELEKEFEEGWELFHKYFFALWL
jgi:hypothetical protein